MIHFEDFPDLGHDVEFCQDLDRMHIPHERAKDILLH